MEQAASQQAPLAGRKALVVGRGEIAAGIAARLAQAGARVLAPETTDSGFSDAPARVAAGLAELGGLDILVLDPLPPPVVTPLGETDDGAFAASLDRVTATAAAMRTALPALRESGFGRIVVIGTRYGEQIAEAIAPYNAAAWALAGLVRSAALDWGRYAISTNLLLPVTATDEYRRARAARPEAIDAMVRQLPLGRMGDPVQDIGGAALFLSGNAARFVSGQTIFADGGQHLAGSVLDPVKLGA